MAVVNWRYYPYTFTVYIGCMARVHELAAMQTKEVCQYTHGTCIQFVGIIGRFVEGDARRAADADFVCTCAACHRASTGWMG